MIYRFYLSDFLLCILQCSAVGQVYAAEIPNSITCLSSNNRHSVAAARLTIKSNQVY